MHKVFVIFIFGILFYFFINSFILKEKDIQKYKKIIQKKNKTSYSTNLKKDTIFQIRNNVRKDIFFIKGKHRFHTKILSDSSSLEIKEKNGKVIFNEKLKNIKCISQDDLSFDKKNNINFQKIKYCTSSFGTYTYPSYEFYSPLMDISFFEIPGKTLPKDFLSYEPYLKGFIKEVFFSMQKNTNNLQAKHFRATFDPSKEFQQDRQ